MTCFLKYIHKAIFAKSFPNIVAIMDVPIKVAVQYSHRFSTIPLDNNAGVNDRAGFIDVRDINAKKNMSEPTIPSITIY